MRKHYINKGFWKLGKKKRKQKGELFGAVAALIVAQVGTQLLGGLVSNTF